METKTLTVQGMMCDACVGHVTKALLGLPGVQTAAVSLAASQAVVTYDPAQVKLTQMQEAIADEGYEVTG